MRRKLIFLFFLISFFPNILNADIDRHCNNKVGQNVLENIDHFKIKKVEIKAQEYRKWITNSLNILTGNFRYVPEKFKRRFDANIIVKFENNLVCNFAGRIRFSGDQKDHITLKENSIIQSLDIHLKNGNIYGITKFKLFLPWARGNFEDEIFVTELLRELNYLAPRTSYVDVKLNNVNTKMIFQEKAVKELLEFNQRREGPIFEGDERFLYRLIEAANLPDNQLSNEEIGAVPLIDAGIRGMFARQTNANWIMKGGKHADISYNSLSNLNNAYLLYLSKYKNKKNNFESNYYGLDNNLIGLGNSDSILKLDIYNLIVLSANGAHGLLPLNRKFYWNSIENLFEPINYDSDFNIDSETFLLPMPISDQIEFAFNDVENLLKEIDVKKFRQKVLLRGLNFDEKETASKINKIRKNLHKLKVIYNNINPEILDNDRDDQINKEMWKKYYDSLYKINPDIYLTKQSPENNSFKRCKIKPLSCADYSFSEQQLRNLLEGRLVINKKEYQYIGKNTESNSLLIDTSYKSVKFNDSYFYFNEGITYSYDKQKKQFNIFQSKPGARAFFYKGSLNEIKISFNGYNEQLQSELQNFPIDDRGLTGCLSLVNLFVKNISIKSNNSSCEDTVNLINVEGTLNEINITDSFSDGLDIDSSKVEINYINIFSSKNDCVDLSAGNYKLNKLNLINCGDKGLSVGEKSFLELDGIFVENSNIGIASKDSSITKINSAKLKNLETCVSAYNKKQEFFGGFMEIKNIKCENYLHKANVDVESKIIIENEL
tara:strand:- start:671 stop:2992 length:2322 start_codon:yes stop_codon:yes gene_type:complete